MYAWSIGEIVGHTKVYDDVQELDSDGIPGRRTRMCFSDWGLTCDWVANQAFSRGVDCTEVPGLKKPLCLEDLHNAKGYHAATGAVAGGWDGSCIATRTLRPEEQMDSSGAAAQAGPYASVDWMWAIWQIVRPITAPEK